MTNPFRICIAGLIAQVDMDFALSAPKEWRAAARDGRGLPVKIAEKQTKESIVVWGSHSPWVVTRS